MNFLNTFSSTVTNNGLFPVWSPAANVIKVDECEAGSTISLNCINGEAFEGACYTLSNESNKVSINKRIQLFVTPKQIIEVSPSQYRVGMGHIQDVHELVALANIKFRTQTVGLLILELKSKKTLKYLMKDPMPCVERIQIAMGRLTGNAGQYLKHQDEPDCDTPASSASSSRRTEPIQVENHQEESMLATALDCRQQSKEIEKLFCLYPSYQLIEKMMNLNRIATECYAQVAGNTGGSQEYLEIVETIQQFLLRDDVIQILDIHAREDSLSRRKNQHEISQQQQQEEPVVMPAVQQEQHVLNEDDEEDLNNNTSNMNMNISLADVSHDELHELLEQLDEEFSELVQSFASWDELDCSNNSISHHHPAQLIPETEEEAQETQEVLLVIDDLEHVEEYLPIVEHDKAWAAEVEKVLLQQ